MGSLGREEGRSELASLGAQTLNVAAGIETIDNFGLHAPLAS